MGEHWTEGNAAEPPPSAVIEFVQFVADGNRVNRFIKLDGHKIVQRLRRRYKLTGMTHIVAHFLRNGWID